MDIKEFLAYLRVSHGPSDTGEYMCKCPAHDDRTASLSVREGDGGKILLHCMAGCAPSAVVQAVGLKLSDLFPDDGRRGRRTAPQRPPKAAPAQAPAAPQERARKPELGRLVKVYPYTDEQGQTLFEVCRFEREENGQRVKTFRQRHTDPTDPKAKHDGIVWNLSGVRIVLYRLPEVMDAVKAGRTVYVVEGEKDADTMASLGFCATTNPGGASKQGATKWLPEFTQALTGANVVILPDNDAAGLNDRQQVAQQLAAVCSSVKMLDLRQACPTLPQKGDVTDMMEIMGTAQGVKALLALEAGTGTVDAEAAKATAARDAAAAIINNLPGYCVDNGCICQWNEENPKRLCTFVALTTGVVIRDNGVAEEKHLAISGWDAAGRALPTVRVPARAFRRMDWLTESWDIRANILPGQTAMDKVRYAISEAGANTATRMVEYTHTGWRKIAGRWAYLYQGGAIGADGVTVDLGTGLAGYTMDAGYESTDERGDMRTLAMITEAIPRRISVPLVAFAFLAPLREPLMIGGVPPAFSMYLVGGSGARKSTISALVLSYFGRFTALTLPASFNDTINHTRKKAFDLKDMLLVIDDYHPEGSVTDRKKMEGMAQQLARAFGDLAQRGRMNADRTLAESMPPRALGLISGEDMPNIGESGTARYYVVNVEKDDIPADEVLTYMQDQAAQGANAHMMRKYIEWLAPQMDTLPAQLSERFKDLRAQAQAMKLGHARAPGAVAHLLVGYEMYMRFLIAEGILEDKDGKLMETEMRRAFSVITANSRAQGEESSEERPSHMFLATIGELLTTGTATVVDLTLMPENGVYTPKKGHIGYMDGQYYYLLPEAAYVAVCEVYTKKGQAFPLTQRMLYKQMRSDELLTPDAVGNKSTRNKAINGKAMRLLWVSRRFLDGPRAHLEQTKMNLNGDTDPDDGTLPF